MSNFYIINKDIQNVMYFYAIKCNFLTNHKCIINTHPGIHILTDLFFVNSQYKNRTIRNVIWRD